MNSFQYAIAKAAWEAHYEATNDAQSIGGFDKLDAKKRREKSAAPQDFGVPVEPSDIHPWLKPHQRAAVQWAVRGGRRALFESFGLGKTVQQLEILRLILKRMGENRCSISANAEVRIPGSNESQSASSSACAGTAEKSGKNLVNVDRGLVVAPLGVRQEFQHDAAQVQIELRFIRSIEEAQETGIYLTNYETVRDGKLDPKHFTVTLFDLMEAEEAPVEEVRE